MDDTNRGAATPPDPSPGSTAMPPAQPIHGSAPAPAEGGPAASSSHTATAARMDTGGSADAPSGATPTPSGHAGTPPPPPLLSEARPSFPPPPHQPPIPMAVPFSHPPTTPPPPPRKGSGWLWTLAILVLIGGVTIVALGFLVDRLRSPLRSAAAGSAPLRHEHLREVLLESAATRDKIAVIDLNGVISSDPWDYQGNTLITFLEEQLEHAAGDDYVKAIVLRIDSPGGEVLASDEIYKLILDFQEEHDKPVVASMGTVAASGGYYVAAPCRWIVANELTITGSIGVIMQSYNWRGLMDKVGVRPQVFKSGGMKDMLSPVKPWTEVTEEEQRIVQNLVNETFDRFKSVIEEGRGLAHARNEDNQGAGHDRGQPLASNWKEFADGRLLSGKDAWKLGMIDELGDFSIAVARARKLAGIEDARLVQYMRPMSFGSLFRLFGKSEEARVRLDLGLEMPHLRSGLYFLAPELAH